MHCVAKIHTVNMADPFVLRPCDLIVKFCFTAAMHQWSLIFEQHSSTILDASGCSLCTQVRILDLASMASVRSFASSWEAEGRLLHVLVNNAGILGMGGERLLTQGWSEPGHGL